MIVILRPLKQPFHVRLGQRLRCFGHDIGAGDRHEFPYRCAGERARSLGVHPGGGGVQHAGRKPGRVDHLGMQHEEGNEAADQTGIGAFAGDNLA